MPDPGPGKKQARTPVGGNRAASSREQILALAAAHQVHLRGFLASLTRDTHLADDLLQDSMVTIGERWQQFQPGSNFLAWALTIARYHYYNAVRNSRQRESVVDVELLEGSLVALVERHPQLQDDWRLRRALQFCLQDLPDRQRQALQRRYQSGCEMEELCRWLRSSRQAVYALLCRARRQLRRCLRLRLEHVERSTDEEPGHVV